ncbi:MAG: histidinol-phosphate transaminase [Chromatiales bacterium]|jgi:histidinol-phosphate aminotransferase|nr:histidinol-phosphate transaminase [Chromatiales bacterium]
MVEPKHATDFAALARPGIRNLSPYQPGKPIEELQRELGIDEVIKLASNENPLGASPRAMAALNGRLQLAERYPDGSGFALKQSLARRWGVDSTQITLGNGSNEVLELLARIFAGPGDEIMFSAHCFVVYPIAAQVVGATPVSVPACNWGHDLDAMAAAITERTRVIYLANPNNPTGTWVNDDTLVRFLNRVPAHVLVALDEAYFEYAERDGYPNGLSLLGQYDNLVVTRTFSKLHGLAALRIGFSVSNPTIADLMNRVRMPFNVNDLGLAAAEAALDDDEHFARSLQANRAGMAQLTVGLAALGLSCIDSAANFVTHDTLGDAGPIYEALLRQGVIVRPIAGYGMPRHLRVTVGTEDENERFLSALNDTLRVAGRI